MNSTLPTTNDVVLPNPRSSVFLRVAENSSNVLKSDKVPIEIESDLYPKISLAFNTICFHASDSTLYVISTYSILIFMFKNYNCVS